MGTRVKIKRLVVAFPSTADAMAAEKTLSALPEHGRLIPVPRTVSAGCGTAWKDRLENREAVRTALDAAGIETDGYYECDFMETAT